MDSPPAKQLAQCERSPMEQVLSNSMLLQHILKYASVSAMKFRSVCKTWNDILLKFPVPKLLNQVETGSVAGCVARECGAEGGNNEDGNNKQFRGGAGDRHRNGDIVDGHGDNKSLQEETLNLSVITNPVILATIFRNLDLTNLKVARLVCKLWSDPGTQELGRVSVLNPRRMCPCDVLWSGLSPLFNTKLAQQIFLVECHPSFHNGNQNPLCVNHRGVSILLQMLPEVQQTNRHLKLVMQPAYLSVILKEMAMSPFPNLKDIAIYFRDQDKPTIQFNTTPPELRRLTSLKSIFFAGREQDAEDQQPKLRDYQNNLLQALIDSAPNLEKLTIEHIHPNLSSCRNLTELHYTDREEKNANILEQMIATLSQVSNLIEDLEFRFNPTVPYQFRSSRDIEDNEWKIARLPTMGNLVSLHLAIHRCARIERSLDITTLPKLKKLHVDIFNDDSTSLCFTNFLTNLCAKHEGVSDLRLSLWELTWPTMLGKLVGSFPNVKNLEVKSLMWKRITETDDEGINNSMDGVIQAFRGWKNLEAVYLKVHVEGQELMMLRAFSKLKNGLRLNKFRCDINVWSIFTRLTENIKHSLLSCKGFYSVKLLRCQYVNQELYCVREDMLKFIQAEKLPIQLEGWDLVNENDEEEESE